MHTSLLAMARRLRPHKAKADFNRLKQQREENRKKGELLLTLQERKVCEEHVDKLCLCNLHANNKCWKSEAEAQEGISNMSGVTVAKESLKHVITICVKGLGWDEYRTPWSHQGAQFTVNYLREHLIFIIKDSAMKNKQVTEPACSLPARKKLPTLGNLTVDVRVKDEEDRDSNNNVNDKVIALREEMIKEGKRDEMKMMQPFGAPDLREGLAIQYIFMHEDNETGIKDAEWCTGTIQHSYYGRKDGVSQVRWHANVDNDKEESHSIVTFKRSLFNVCKEKGWRLYFDMPWSNLPLHVLIRKENENENHNQTTDITVQ